MFLLVVDYEFFIFFNYDIFVAKSDNANSVMIDLSKYIKMKLFGTA